MVSSETVRKIGKDIIRDLTRIDNPSIIWVFEIGNLVLSSPIKDRYVEIFGISVPFSKPVNTGVHFPIVIFLFKDIIELRFKPTF